MGVSMGMVNTHNEPTTGLQIASCYIHSFNCKLLYSEIYHFIYITILLYFNDFKDNRNIFICKCKQNSLIFFNYDLFMNILLKMINYYKFLFNINSIKIKRCFLILVVSIF